MISSVLYACVLVFTLATCLVRGANAERKIAMVVILGNLATIAVLLLHRRFSYSSVSVAYIGVDIAAVFALCWLAVGRPSWMSILVAVFQINSALGHAVKLAAPDTFSLSYAVLLRLWAWPMVLTMLVAHWHEPMRRVLRQSDLQRLPKVLRPHGNTATHSPVRAPSASHP